MKTKYLQLNIQLKTIPTLQRSILFCTLLTRGSGERRPSAKRAARGSLTLEAALTLPFVIILFLSILQLITASVFQVRLMNAMEQAGRRLASYYYAVAETTDEEEKGLIARTIGSVVSYAVTGAVVRGMVFDTLKPMPDLSSLIDGGADGISFYLSHYEPATQSIRLFAEYRVRIPFFPLKGLSLPVLQYSTHRVWTGKEMPEHEEEQMVYVTETGTVYHTALSCTSLSLSIREVSRSKLDTIRNANGSIYHTCEYCGEGTGDKVYVTTHGVRYHSDKTCSGLKRSIQSIPISEVGDRALCKRCQAREKH